MNNFLGDENTAQEPKRPWRPNSSEIVRSCCLGSFVVGMPLRWRFAAYMGGIACFSMGLFVTVVVHEQYSGSMELTGRGTNLRGLFFKVRDKDRGDMEFGVDKTGFEDHIAIQSLESSLVPNSLLENIYLKGGEEGYDEESESETWDVESNTLDPLGEQKSMNKDESSDGKAKALAFAGIDPNLKSVKGLLALRAPPGGKVAKSHTPNAMVAGPGKKLVASKPTEGADCDNMKESRYYKVGKRKDFKSSITDAITTLKLCKQVKSSGYDFYWDETFDQKGDKGEIEKYFSVNIKSGAMVSSVPGVRETIGLKPR